MSNEPTPVDFPSVLALTPYGTSLEMKFKDTRELQDWAKNELDIWHPLESERSSRRGAIGSLARKTLESPELLVSQAAEVERLHASSVQWNHSSMQECMARINRVLNDYQSGAAACSDSQEASRAIALLPDNPRSAAALLYLYAPDTERTLAAQLPGNTPLTDVLRAIVDLSDGDLMSSIGETSKHAWDQLRNKSEAELRVIQGIRSEEAVKLEQFWDARSKALGAQEKAWAD